MLTTAIPDNGLLLYRTSHTVRSAITATAELLHTLPVLYFYKLDFFTFLLLLLSGEVQTERCRTDDLMPSIPVLCLPSSRVDPKVLGLNVLMHSSLSARWILDGQQVTASYLLSRHNV